MTNLFKNFFNRALELSKTSEKQRGRINFWVGNSANTVFGLIFILKSRLLVDVFRLFDGFKTFFINRVLELSKANEKQSRSINFSVGTSANTAFGLVFILKVAS